MYEIKRLSDSINNRDYFNLQKTKILDFTQNQIEHYPNYNNWYNQKMIKGVHNKSREIIYIEQNEKIIGVIFLKNEEEKKICTFYIDEEFRNKGFGSYLLEEGLKYLDEKTPTITINEKIKEQYNVFIDKYNWILTKKENNKYKMGETEYIYNSKN